MRATALLLLVLTCRPACPQPYLDLAPSSTTSGAGDATVLAWAEERDVREIRVRWTARPEDVRIEYWFRNWPYAPPQMPTIEDPVDDPWQGRWLSARSAGNCRRLDCRYTFAPLAPEENPRAANLPGVSYRRTLKIRLSAKVARPAAPPAVFSDSRAREMAVEVTFDGPHEFLGAAVYNGRLKSTTRTAAGARLALTVSDPAPPGSNDITVVTVRARPATFSFSLEDLKGGPIRIPAFHAVVTAGPPDAPPPAGRRIREMIPAEPEQSYERASREIPPLDPWERQGGDRVYLPLAPDSSWQKFAFEYGGNVFASKRGTKAKGAELRWLAWEGDRLTWKIGTGAEPYYRDDRKASAAKLEGWLPVVTQTWENDGLRWSEEAFSLPLRGPLSPHDAARSEQTPAILMLALTAANPSSEARTAHVWLHTEPAEPLRLEGRELHSPAGLRAVVEADGGEILGGRYHTAFPVPPGGRRTVILKLPFIPGLDQANTAALHALAYAASREVTVTYWTRVINAAARFQVPEPKFDALARSAIAHIRIGATKDPRSGLFIVPAASYGYQQFANETCFQVLLLDALGDHATARDYLETLLRLQGSRNFPGLHTGPPDAIFHGVKVDEEYDYTASNYGLDHGTVLWTLAEHYLYTRDDTWFARAWPHMRKAAEWIVRQRAATGNGLLPASHLEDNSDWAQWFSINAFAWAGLDRTARALAVREHPETAAMRAEAGHYRAGLRAAVEQAWEAAPVTRLRDGTYVPYVPVQPRQRFRLFGPLRTDYYSRYGKPDVRPTFRLSATREVLYGPLILLALGVFEPHEPVADWILDDWEDNLTLTSGLGLNVHGLTDESLWFSQGGMVFQANLQNPVLVYLRRHEIPAALRALYNAFAACLYPEVNVFTEEYRMWGKASGPFYKAPDEARFVNRLRDMLVLEDGATLWLASGVPRRWLEAPEGIRVTWMATHFGPVSYLLRPASEPGTLEAVVRPPVRNPAARVLLVARTPSGRILEATVDGHPLPVDAVHEAVELPAGAGPFHIRIRYR